MNPPARNQIIDSSSISSSSTQPSNTRARKRAVCEVRRARCGAKWCVLRAVRGATPVLNICYIRLSARLQGRVWRRHGTAVRRALRRVHARRCSGGFLCPDRRKPCRRGCRRTMGACSRRAAQPALSLQETQHERHPSRCSVPRCASFAGSFSFLALRRSHPRVGDRRDAAVFSVVDGVVLRPESGVVSLTE